MQRFTQWFRQRHLGVRWRCVLTLAALMITAATGTGQTTSGYTIIDLGTLGGSSSSAVAINAAGDVAGVSMISTPGVSHAFLYSGGVMTDLGTLGGKLSQGHAINIAGEVTGWAYTPENVLHAFLYSRGTMTDLGTLGGARSSGYAINAAGQVTGWAETAGNKLRAFLYSDGGLIDLGTLGGSYSFGNAINDAGEVTGGAATPWDIGEHAFLYSRGSMIDLGAFGGAISRGNAINATGEVTGFSYTADNESHAFLYSGGVLRDLGTLGGTVSFGNAINAAGHVTGASLGSGDSPLRAFVYTGGALIDLGTFGGPRSEGLAINDAGDVVGHSQTLEGTPHAFRYRGGIVTDLNTLIPPDSGWTLWSATAINNRGQITGLGFRNGELRAFLLTPGQTYTASVQPPIRADGSSAFNANRGVVPVRFTLTVDQIPTCELPPATIAVTRIPNLTMSLFAESISLNAADEGTNFRITDCQYVYHLAAPPLGEGRYRVDILIDGLAIGHAEFSLR